MAIFGSVGGLGCGKTMVAVYYILKDMYNGKTIYSNIKFKNVKPYRIRYLTKERIHKMFELVKTKKLDLTNSTIFLDEIHNYFDSRNSMSTKNKVGSYWVLQSRHTGRGSCDIVYTTQELGQVDVRIRNNTDHIFRPQILRRIDPKDKDSIPTHLLVNYQAYKGQRKINKDYILAVHDTPKHYDTHELIDF